MPDHARSTDPAVQAQLDRLWALSPGADVLGLGRITALLARLGDPHLSLPPVFHVAGTNGKGSTCAFLRAAIEAQGLRCHVYASPHLVRFNERIRLAGELIDDAALAALLAEVLDAGGDLGASFFEVTTAAAFLAFARTPADACVIEVGLGGRLDATNVLASPVACGIAALGIDHESFLLAPEPGTPAEPLPRIAFEKAGIAKRGTSLVTQLYPADMTAAVADVADARGAPLVVRGKAWDITDRDGALHYRDAAGIVPLPQPALAGRHQAANAGLAVAMLRHQDAIAIGDAALSAAMTSAVWPARLQRLSAGPLRDRLPAGTRLWLDGGHNPSAAQVIADALPAMDAPPGRALVLGMLANKDARGFLAPLAALFDTLVAVPIDDHAHHAPADLASIAGALGWSRALVANDLPSAMDRLATAIDPPKTVLIGGSLYLAGEALAANDEPPT